MVCRYSKVRNFRIHQEQDALLTTVARRHGLSVSELLRDIVTRHLQQKSSAKSSGTASNAIDTVQMMSLIAAGGQKISKQAIFDTLNGVWSQDFPCVRAVEHHAALILIPLSARKPEKGAARGAAPRQTPGHGAE